MNFLHPQVSLSKGEVVARLMLRSDDAELLERLKSLPMVRNLIRMAYKALLLLRASQTRWCNIRCKLDAEQCTADVPLHLQLLR